MFGNNDKGTNVAYDNLQPDDFCDFAGLLPDSVLTIAQVAGFAAAYTLVTRLGGTVMPIGLNVTRQGKALHAFLAEYVGEDAAHRIEAAFGGEGRLQIPKCKDLMRAVRNRAIRRDFDEYTAKGRMSANLAVNNIALDYDLAARQVWVILKSPERLPAKPQPCLFG